MSVDVTDERLSKRRQTDGQVSTQPKHDKIREYERTFIDIHCDKEMAMDLTDRVIIKR
jgi:hypothetical protein